MGTFGASCGFILLADMANGKVEALNQRGMVKDSIDTLSRTVESGCCGELKEVSGIQILDERDGAQNEGRPKIFNLLSSCSIKIWIPFNINEDFKGGIGLGEKLSGDPYTLDDQELLSTMSRQGAVAIENWMLVEKMKKEETMRTNLARYLSPQIVEQIIKKNMQVNLGGDRKVVTVVFSDVRNFTRIAETLPPDRLAHILNEYFTEMARIIFKNQGSLDKYIGDAIIAVFGSLIPLKNSSQNAVQTAIQMMHFMSVVNEKWMKKYEFTMNIGIGINTGEVFLGNIASPERLEFTVIGDTVNTASRSSGMAQPGQILITKGALTPLGPDIKHKELPPTEVRGKAGKMEVFEVIY